MIDRRMELPEGVPPLNTYYVYMTGGCNLACQHCWIAPTYQANGGTGGHLDYDLFAQAIEEGLLLGLGNIKLTGGEPLLHPDFIRFVDLIREKNLGLTIETNATLMTESLARYLKERSTLGHISVSLDGATAATHDPFRGVKGSFEKAVQGIRYLVGAGFHPQVIMSLHIGNVDEIEALVQLAEGLGVASVKFNMVQSTGRGQVMAEREKTLDLNELIKMGRWLEEDLQKRVTVPLIYSWPMAFFSINRLLTFQGYSCHINNILGVLSSGHLALCGIGLQEPDLTYGKIGKDSIRDIWATHPGLISLREALPVGLQGVCGECVFRDRCMGVCVAQNYHLHKDITAPYWFCDEADKLGLFPITRKRRN